MSKSGKVTKSSILVRSFGKQLRGYVRQGRTGFSSVGGTHDLARKCCGHTDEEAE